MIEIFNPKTIAIIGATERKKSVGRGLVENLSKEGKELFYVNPFQDYILGKNCYPKISDIDTDIDLAIIAIPKESVPEVVDDCIKAKVKAVIIISAGFAETGQKGKEVQDQIAAKLKKAKIPLVGPNCLGILRPPVGLNASFAPTSPSQGDIALISQSGALIDSIIYTSKDQNYGFSLIVSVGNAAGLNLVDYIRMADEDKHSKVITLYVEGVKNGREFLDALKATKKPIVVIKAGKTAKSKKAIASHTGSMAGEYEIFSAALRQGGAIEANSLEELFDIAKTMAWQSTWKGKVGIVTNGGGAGVLLTDSFDAYNLDLAKLSDNTKKKIASKMHPDYSAANPVDIVGDALPNRYETACREFLKQKDVAVLIVIQTLQIMTEPVENAKRLIRLHKEFQKPMIAVFMGESQKTKEAIKVLENYGIPNFSDPSKVAKPLQALMQKNNE